MIIDKRLPFGAKGEWGKCYKLYNNDLIENETIQYLDNTYYDIGQDIQIKELTNSANIENAQPIRNLIAQGEYKIIETTDAFFNAETKRFECVISPNDILNVFNEYWVVEKIEERSIYTPNKQTFYYVSIKKIFGNILTGV